MPTEQIISRIRRALLLDQTAFDEVRDDDAFTPFALAAAAIAALIGALGAYLWGEIVLQSTPDRFLIDSVILGSIFLILLWGLGVLATYLVLSQVYREEIAPDALARLVAVGYVPFALSLLVFIPQIGFGFAVLAVAAMFFYTITGLRAAFPAIDPMRVMLAVAAGFAVWLMVLPLLTTSDDAFAPGIFIFEWAGDVVDDLTGAFSSLTDYVPPS